MMRYERVRTNSNAALFAQLQSDQIQHFGYKWSVDNFKYWQIKKPSDFQRVYSLNVTRKGLEPPTVRAEI